MQIDASPANYDPNSIGNNWPRETPPEKGGFTTSPQTVSGVKERCGAPPSRNTIPTPGCSG